MSGELTALINVRVFDGRTLLAPGPVLIDGDRVVAEVPGGRDSDVREVDCAGGVLLPGLIDAHVHLNGRRSLERLAGFGVTTALDMASGPPALVDSLRGLAGVTDIRSAGTPAIAPGSMHSHIPEVGQRGLLSGADQAERFVADRIAEGSDYIKIVIGSPGADHDQDTIQALVAAAHQHGKLVVAHASNDASVHKALLAGVDILTHVPSDLAVDAATAARTAAAGHVVIPTLTMMEGLISRLAPPGAHYDACRAGVAELYRVGVPILAGTDANASPGAPVAISHGDSLHRELELLVEAGLSNIDALRAATVLPARHFGLADRGVIEPGRRADLVLVDGDPTTDISATRAIVRIWCGGAERGLAPS
jgi:imidazolonepropionase-like amidohydrolase